MEIPRFFILFLHLTSCILWEIFENIWDIEEITNCELDFLILCIIITDSAVVDLPTGREV